MLDVCLFTQVPRVFGAILSGSHLVDLVAATTRQTINFGKTLLHCQPHCQGQSFIGTCECSSYIGCRTRFVMSVQYTLGPLAITAQTTYAYHDVFEEGSVRTLGACSPQNGKYDCLSVRYPHSIHVSILFICTSFSVSRMVALTPPHQRPECL